MSTTLEVKKQNNHLWLMDVVKEHLNPMSVLLFFMAFAIIAFNVMGYKELFNETGSLFGITPFGGLIGIAEVAVLVWTSNVIKIWPEASRILKFSTFFVVAGFWFLCFTGINSYLKNSAYNELEQFQTAKTQYDNNEKLLASIDEQIAVVQAALTTAGDARNKDNESIDKLQSQANDISEKMSKRRENSLVCDTNPDCAAAVADFKQQVDRTNRQIDLLYRSVAEKQSQMAGYEVELAKLNKDKRELARQNRDSMNLHAQSESSFSVKKQTYENIVVGIYETFGLSTPEDPFSIFIGFISFIIYPVYLMLNLYTSLGSEANRVVREANKRVRMEQAIRKAEIDAEIRAEKEAIRKDERQIRNAINREKRLIAHKKAMDKIKYNNINRGKLLKYFRVWANRRKKTCNIEVIREVEVEVEIEVERIIEKPVEIFVEKEVRVEIEKIIPVEKEVPVYIDRVKKVSEPVFITEPQVVIHERIIPVPENISAKELEELMASLPSLNEVAKNEPKMTVVQ